MVKKRPDLCLIGVTEEEDGVGRSKGVILEQIKTKNFSELMKKQQPPYLRSTPNPIRINTTKNHI